jgi:hypothetical protein
MARYKNCGEEIIFRMIDGRCVPIRASAGWDSGSRSGTGDARQTERRECAARPSKSFTHPTKCPKCGDAVFYIEHNGGSVWFDDLGWPWPKHGCFDDEPATCHFAAWSANASTLSSRELGVVTAILPDGRQAEPVLELEMNNSTRLTLILQWTPPRQMILDALVVVSLRDNILLHPGYGRIPFHSANTIGTAQSPLGDELSLDEEIQRAADRVARKAWKAVSKARSRSDRVSLAKIEALHIISGFPSPLKGKVEHHFTSRKWEPLLSRIPKT